MALRTINVVEKINDIDIIKAKIKLRKKYKLNSNKNFIIISTNRKLKHDLCSIDFENDYGLVIKDINNFKRISNIICIKYVVDNKVIDSIFFVEIKGL